MSEEDRVPNISVSPDVISVIVLSFILVIVYVLLVKYFGG